MRFVTRQFAVLCLLLLPLSANSHAQFSRPALPPLAPTDLVATVVGSTVTLDWLPPVGSVVTGYSLEAALTAAGAAIASVPVASSHISVPGVPSGTYFLRVHAVNGDGTSPPSNEIMIVVGSSGCASPPSPPTNLTFDIDGGTVALQWQAPVAGCAATHYVLQAGSAPTLADLATATLGLSTGLTTQGPPGTYFVRVVAVNALGSSAPSNEIVLSIGPSCTVPGSPQNFSANAVGSMASLQWSAPSTGGAPENYLLEAGTGPQSSDLAVVPLTGLSFSSPVPPGSYFLRIRASNACGAGPASETRLLSVVCAPPGTPSSPTASVFGSTATVSWTGVAGATQYRFEVGTASGANNMTAQTVNGTSHQLSGLASGTYFMRVRAINSCGSGAPSGEGMFSIAAPPSSASCGGASAPTTVTCINGGHTGTPTARCDDGAWSCSQNRSGTCSYHGGVSCWVCPGILCS